MTAIATRVRSAKVPAAVAVAIGLAWVAAIAAHATGSRHLVDHDALIDGTAARVPAVLTYGAAWVVMVAAMMLPSTVPLLRLFVAASDDQPRRGAVLGAFVGGYIAIWTTFGWLALLFDTAVHESVHAVPWLDARPAVVTGAVLMLAGAFQFSSLKDKCLTACRHPATYLLAHYRRGLAAAWRLGKGHGLFCLGCCWALMLVAFATGMTDLRLMAGFTALMAYEKVGRHGVAAAHLAGVALFALGGALAVSAV
jgi:predicted metal-binding membrane protein